MSMNVENNKIISLVPANNNGVNVPGSSNLPNVKDNGGPVGGNENAFNINTNIININSNQRDSDVSGGGLQGSQANIMNVVQRLASAGDELQQPNQVQNGDEVGLGAVQDADLIDKPPAFSLDELRQISSGNYNVGELKLTSKGTLEKINNHVSSWYAGENTVTLTPEQNLDVRRQVCKCFMDNFGDNPRINTVKELLLNERDRDVSLSRDEVAFLFKMLEANDSETYSVDTFKKLHDFKVGKLTDIDDVKPFIKGLAPKHENADESVKNIVKAVSINARQGIVSDTLHEILAAFRTLPAGVETKSAHDVDRQLRTGGNFFFVNPYAGAQAVSLSDMKRMVENFKRTYRLPGSLQLTNAVANDEFSTKCKGDIYKRLQEEFREYLQNSVWLPEYQEKVKDFLGKGNLSETITPKQKDALNNLYCKELRMLDSRNKGRSGRSYKEFLIPVNPYISEMEMMSGNVLKVVFFGGNDDLFPAYLRPDGTWTLDSNTANLRQ